MKTTAFRTFMLLMGMAVLSCILLCGAQRLVGRADEAPPIVPGSVSAKQAILVSAASCAQETGAQQGRTSCVRVDEVRQSAQLFSAAGNGLIARRDANGNVLPGRGSYLRMVYQAFPLGDGFV